MTNVPATHWADGTPITNTKGEAIEGLTMAKTVRINTDGPRYLEGIKLLDALYHAGLVGETAKSVTIKAECDGLIEITAAYYAKPVISAMRAALDDAIAKEERASP